jgi:hypothetical protein
MKKSPVYFKLLILLYKEYKRQKKKICHLQAVKGIETGTKLH